MKSYNWQTLRFFLTIVCLLGGLLLQAQEIMVTGRVVTLGSGDPLVGATVMEKGSKNTVMTEADGSFKIGVPERNAFLEVSYVGMQTRTLAVGRSNQNVVIELEGSASALTDVVVVGFGTQKRRDLTSSIGTVTAATIQNQTLPNALSAVQGRLAGVQITNSGSPGAAPAIRIRGTGSVFNTAPLFVVDGVMVNDISYLGPNDIDNISVLRDASASAIYGLLAANGVVLITTKKGSKDGRVRVVYNAYVGQKRAANLLEMVNTSEWITLYNERMDLNNTPNNKLNPANFPNSTDWYDQILNSSNTHSHDLSIQGGTEWSNYNLGFNYLQEDGLIKKDKFERLTVRGSFDFKISKYIQAGINTVVTASKANPSNGSVLLEAFRSIPLFVPVDSPGRFTNPTIINGFAPDPQTNPAATIFYTNRWRNQINAFTSAYVQVKLMQGFEFRSTFGFNPNFTRSINFTPKYTVSPSQRSVFNVLSKDNSTNSTYTWDNTLSYTKRFDKGHRVKVMVGSIYRENRSEFLNGVATDIVDLPAVNSSFLFLTIGRASSTTTLVAADGGSKNTQLGYMGRVTYDYLDKYLLNFTMRADGSSRFPKNNRWGYFPSVGLGWIITKEKFMEQVKAVDFMKLRVGWGLLGNGNVPGNLYQLTTSNGTPVIFGNTQNTGTGLVSPSTNIRNNFNPNLKWEVVNETNIGLDVRTFKNRLSTTIDWYYKLTQDAVFATTALGSSGINSNGVFGNYANILNTGIELTLDWQDQVGKWQYGVGFNATWNKNEVKSISSSGAAYFDKGDATNNITPLTRTRVGHPVGEFFGYRVIGIFQNQAQIDATPHLANTLPGHVIFQDVNQDGIIDAKDRTDIGNPNVPFFYGFNANLSYANFDLVLLCQGVAGNKIFNENRLLGYTTKNFDREFYRNRWTGEGSTNSYPNVLVNPGDPRTPSSYYVESGSYFRIKNLQLGYSMPLRVMQRMKIQKLRFFVNAENPVTVFSYNGFSPEVPSTDPLLTGVNNGVYPLSSIYSFGVNLTF